MNPEKVVDLRSRTGYKPDLGALARSQVAAARNRLGVSTEEFAAVLAPLLGWEWELTPELVESWESTTTPPGDVLVAASLATEGAHRQGDSVGPDAVTQLIGDRFADLSAVYATRSEFTAAMPPTTLFKDARQIDIAGLSLNLLCQQYPDQLLRASIERGATLRSLFLDPAGEEIKRYEREEGHLPGHISTLTEINIQALLRIRDHLPAEAQERIQISTYNDTPHFNLILIDQLICVMQPYLPETRGVDSPTFVVHRQSSAYGLYPIFDQIFDVLWRKGKQL